MKKVCWRKSFRVVVVVILFVFISHMWGTVFAADVSPAAKEFLRKMSDSLSQVSEVTRPSVVNISTTTIVTMKESPLGQFFSDPYFRRFFGDDFGHPSMPRKFMQSALGSGVIMSRDGYILTNYHVIKDAQEIKVILYDKREFAGKVIGADPLTDIAIVKVDAQDLPAIRIGDSGKLKAGDIVLAIGNPFGLNQTVTMGIVSAVGRANVGISSFEDFIQTDAAINPGNSGGALVNTNGELVGINTAIFSTSGGYVGIGFAIPSDMADAVAQSILKYGRVIRGWLGVTVEDLTPALSKSFGVKTEKGALVTDVVKNGPADKAGLERGDIIVEFEGKPVEDTAELRNQVASAAPGKAVPAKVIRSGKEETLTITIGEFPEKKPLKKVEYNNALKGVEVEDLTPDLRESLNIAAGTEGVLVVTVSEDSPAYGSVMKNDVIEEVGHKPIKGVKEYDEIVSGIKPSDTALLLIYRNGGNIFVAIKASESTR
jgi:serine protease Do